MSDAAATCLIFGYFYGPLVLAYYVGMVFLGWYGKDGDEQQTTAQRLIVNPAKMTASASVEALVVVFGLWLLLFYTGIEWALDSKKVRG